MPLTKEQVLEGIKKLKEGRAKRNFIQSVDMQVSLRDTDVKKPENKIKESIVLPHPLGKKISVAALVDKELIVEARKIFDDAILKDDFSTLKKSDIKKLARKHKFFVAQANLMGDVAKVFGRIFGPKGKMPDPKAGCIIPPKNELLKPVYEKLQRTVKIRIKDQPTINVMVGTESLSDEELADNILAVYKVIVSKLPRGESQINKVHIKMTMSKGVVL